MACTARDRSRSPHGGGSYQEIMTLVVEREKARLNKDWTQADTIRATLQEMGVTLFDKTMQWQSADGRTGRIPRFGEIDTAGGNQAEEPRRPYDENEERIKELVRQREQARASKDFAESDKLREELKANGVELNDREKLWKCSSRGLQGIIVGHRKDGQLTDIEISTLVVQREKARQSNDYAMSDIIRDELKVHGVMINDKRKMWHSTDGREGPVPSWGEIMGETGGAGGGGGGGGGAGQSQANMQQQLVQAAMACAAQPAIAGRALQMLNQLLQQAGQNGMYSAAPSAAPGRPSPRPPAPTGPPELGQLFQMVQQLQASGRRPTDQQIASLVTAREGRRKARDFAASDKLREALTSFGVQLLEKEKRWTCSDGRQGDIPLWDDIHPN